MPCRVYALVLQVYALIHLNGIQFSLNDVDISISADIWKLILKATATDINLAY